MTDFTQDIGECVKVLQSGGIILYPTDTVWGIGCDATNPAAVEKIYQLKKRPGKKAMIVLVADEKDILNYVASPDPRLFDYLDTLERPTTIVYEGAIGLAGNLVGEDGSIAIRICKETFCRHLLKRFRKPIVSTSANNSGQPVALNYAGISEEIKNGVDYIVKYRQDEKTISSPSSLIKWNRDGSVTVLRG
jgi:L-threonylcarbamoyladenylate synthase